MKRAYYCYVCGERITGNVFKVYPSGMQCMTVHDNVCKSYFRACVLAWLYVEKEDGLTPENMFCLVGPCDANGVPLSTKHYV